MCCEGLGLGDCCLGLGGLVIVGLDSCLGWSGLRQTWVRLVNWAYGLGIMVRGLGECGLERIGFVGLWVKV